MAASDFIKSLIEPARRQALSDACDGVEFRQRKMPIRWKGEGTGSFEFDAVSADGRVIASLSTARTLNAGQRHKLMRDATFMWLVPDARDRGERFSIPMQPQHTPRYVRLGQENEFDSAIHIEWSNGGYAAR